ncbi:hypothetical protein [Streptomyces sp. NBC_01092]|uniref:hypothetical protein n=1 Tax=Streptomyces sp. NBC_01092 TaxID=2903748 RepID=UPI00386570D6|nr:hypothetical protein OG254_38810 [Streptomyces sp. NBC_01092]
MCCLFGECGAIGGAAEETRVNVDPVSGTGQQQRGPVGQGLHGDLVHLVRDLMPDVALDLVPVEAEGVEQDQEMFGGVGAGVDVDRSVAVVKVTSTS